MTLPRTRSGVLARIAAHPLGSAPAEMRAGFAALAAGPEGLPDGVSIKETSTGLTVAPLDASNAREIVWFHGGGYVFGAPETHLRPAAYLAARHRFRVTLPRYPLAPENPWPTQRDAALAAIGGRDVILAGDSAGGHLALVTALARGRSGQPPRGLLLFSPNADRSGLSDTRQANDALDPMVDDAGDARLARLCFGDMARDHPEVSPVRDDLSLLPPTWLEVGTQEVLLGDARALHRLGRAQGADVRIHEADDLLHMAQLWAPEWSVAGASLDRAAAFARQIDG
ncbi:alpha/beta hydrolase [Jannaschia sp. M317]|uniref:alpha/beta hydrolase n=1 Tax=Jannaschia sp. M317 TaxID=2867011 RepID=UPI0021A806E0|nr:alpha/beta hydrolase [Jannaschia sp. M317]UWQ17134.1 alpha/beta hydrolase [Jannaschia sp. M317]